MPVADQVTAVQARLVADHADVEAVAIMCGNVRRLTAALIYVACGCRLRRCRKVVKEASMTLRGHRGSPGWHPGQTELHRTRYQQALLANVLALAKRTTAGRKARRP